MEFLNFVAYIAVVILLYAFFYGIIDAISEIASLNPDDGCAPPKKNSTSKPE